MDAYPGGVNRIARFFGAQEPWERPMPVGRERRQDYLLAAAWTIGAVVNLELVRSAAIFGAEPAHLGWQYLATLSAGILLVWRRRFPLVVAALATIHMFTVATLMPMVMSGLVIQVVYFFAIYSGVAWARHRQRLVFVSALILAITLGWLGWMFATSVNSPEREELMAEFEPAGVLDPFVAGAAYASVSNLLYFGGAILLGQLSWNAARRTAQVIEQAATIERQADRLRDQAVVAERLRIARELHDVVAHHVSVMGVQAAAARRVLERDPVAARDALQTIEGASRQAVGQMRDLLGTLRSSELAAAGAAGAGAELSDGRAPQPLIADITTLVHQSSTPSVRVDYSLVEEVSGGAAAVADVVQLAAYRVVQESLANVLKHSTASRVTVVLRVADHVEVEVVDNGHPRTGTSGTQLGQLGIRERAQHLGGIAEVGPRHGGGYRVRVRLPVQPAVTMAV